MKRKLGISLFSALVIFGVVVGCASLKAEVLVKLDPRVQWSEEPLTNLVSRVSPLYAPALRPQGLSLSEVLWQPRKSQIPENFTLNNKILNDEVGYVQMVYGSSPQQMWIYIGEDMQTVSEVSDVLQRYEATNDGIEFIVDGTNEISTQLLESQDKSAYAVAFSLETVDIVVIWNQRPMEDMQQILNSLISLKPQDSLTKNLEQEFLLVNK